MSEKYNTGKEKDENNRNETHDMYWEANFQWNFHLWFSQKHMDMQVENQSKCESKGPG